MKPVTGTFGVGSDERFLPVPSIRVIGPGRAGTSLAGALQHNGWSIHPFISRADDPALAAHGTDVLAIAVGDSAIAAVARQVRPVPGTLVIHLAGSVGTSVLEPHERRAALHPLMTLPNTDSGVARLRHGATFGVSGDPGVETIVSSLHGRSYTIADADRARYHAGATIASNHLVALAAQVERCVANTGVPLDAYLAMMRATIDNIEATSPLDALTGPASRGDEATIERHLAVLDAEVADAYRAMARIAASLAGRTLEVLA